MSASPSSVLVLTFLGLVGVAGAASAGCGHRSEVEVRDPNGERAEKSETNEKRDGATAPSSAPAPSSATPAAQTEKAPAEKAATDPKAMPTCSAKDDVEHAGRTGVEGAKTGVLTGVEGVKTFGKATAGLFQGGSDEAARRWNEGKEQTKATAREGASKTREEANAPPCK